MKTVLLEYKGDFDSNYRIDYRGDYYTFDSWTGDTEKELIGGWAEATLDSGSGGSSGDFGPVAVPLTASEAAMVLAWARARARQADAEGNTT